MSRRILISENERSRILGLHENLRIKEWGLINEQVEGALSAELKAKNIKITALQDPPRGELSNWTLTDGSKINAGYHGFFVNEVEDTTIHYMDNGMTLKADKKNAKNDDGLPYEKLPNWTDKPIDGAKTVVTPASTVSTAVVPSSTTASPVIDTANLASRRDIRQQYRQGKKDVRDLKGELRQYQNTLQRMANKMTPEQNKQYETKIAQLQIQINQSAA